MIVDRSVHWVNLRVVQGLTYCMTGAGEFAVDRIFQLGIGIHAIPLETMA